MNIIVVFKHCVEGCFVQTDIILQQCLERMCDVLHT